MEFWLRSQQAGVNLPQDLAPGICGGWLWINAVCLRLCGKPGKKNSQKREPPINGKAKWREEMSQLLHPLWTFSFPKVPKSSVRCSANISLYAANSMKVMKERDGWDSFIHSINIYPGVFMSQILKTKYIYNIILGRKESKAHRERIDGHYM